MRFISQGGLNIVIAFGSLLAYVFVEDPFWALLGIFNLLIAIWLKD
jgi:hypothetical protein